MSNNRTFAGALGALLLFSMPAAAQGAGPNAWTGFYAGGHIGHGSAGSGEISINGIVGGVQAGYMRQFGQVVAGIEADYSGGNVGDTVDFSGSFGGTNVNVNIKVDVESMWSVRGRLGFVASPDLLIYGTLGYGGYDVSLNVTATSGTASAAISGSADVDGVVFGAGVEYAFIPRLLGRLEILRYTGSGWASGFGNDYDLTVVRSALSYKM